MRFILCEKIQIERLEQRTEKNMKQEENKLKYRNVCACIMRK